MLLTVFLVFVLTEFPQVKSFQWNAYGNVEWAMGCDFAGNDLANVRINGENCASKCLERPGCTHFAWTNYNSGESVKQLK